MSTVYFWVLLAHSWLRWVVLGLGVWLLIVAAGGMRGGGQWGPRHDRLHARFLAALDTQFLLGLLLYFVLSPLSSAAMHDLGAAMKNPPLRFFGLEHAVTMLLAIASAHIGRTRSKRKSGSARYRTTFIAQLIWLVLTLLAIPWPMLDIGRPLFRWGARPPIGLDALSRLETLASSDAARPQTAPPFGAAAPGSLPLAVLGGRQVRAIAG